MVRRQRSGLRLHHFYTYGELDGSEADTGPCVSDCLPSHNPTVFIIQSRELELYPTVAALLKSLWRISPWRYNPESPRINKLVGNSRILFYTSYYSELDGEQPF